ncbi:MAG TPA: TonB family protein [Pyrinomonadaceae bacterium]|nr:TonB family protein [Pyrinomonadaceae bacterium]
MLDKLVESKNNGKDVKRVKGLFGAAMSLAAIGLIFAFTVSMFGFELGLGNSDLDFSSLNAPVMVEDNAPEPQKLIKEKSSENVKSELPTRVANIQRLDESPAKSPNDVSVTPSKLQARPDTPFRLGLKDFTPATANGIRSNRNQEGKTISDGISNNNSKIIDNDEKDDAPIIKKTEKPQVKKEDKPKPPVTVSRGVVNGSAKFLAQPVYPQTARQVRAMGKVEVQVLIDETGRVTSATVVSGHTMLRQPALDAARKSTFNPTTLSNNPVKVSGVIVYNFTF